MSDQGRTTLAAMEGTIDTIERDLLANLSSTDVDQLRSLLSKVR